MSRDEKPAPPLDLRARRSKQALEAALLELVEVQDLAQISVSDIAKHAGVSRSTFYEHYSGVHDLAARACTAMFDDLVVSLPLVDPRLVDVVHPQDNPLVPFFTHFAQHARLYRSLLGPDGSARVINHLLYQLRTRTDANFSLAADSRVTPGPDFVEITPRAEPALIAGALLGVVTDWLNRARPEAPAQVAAAVWPQLLAATIATGLEPDPAGATDPA